MGIKSLLDEYEHDPHFQTILSFLINNKTIDPIETIDHHIKNLMLLREAITQ